MGYLTVRQQIERTTGADLQAALRLLVLDSIGVKGVRLAMMPTDLANVTMGNASDYHPGLVYHRLLVGPVTSAAVLLDRLMGADFLAAELRNKCSNLVYLVGR